MKTFELGQEVVILDGTSLVGIVASKEVRGDEGEFYAVSLNGYGGRWYSAAELAPAPAAAEPTADGGGVDDSGYTELIDELSGRIKGVERENATMIRELAMLEGERNRLRQQLAAAVAALQPFANAYHIFNDQFAIDYGNIINWQTDFANVNAVTEWYKQALAIVGALQPPPAAAVPGEGE